MRRATNIPCILTLFACLFHVGCFEEPVREHVHIYIGGPKSIGVSVVQEVASPDIARGNREVENRMDEARDALAEGWDRWSRILANQRPDAQRTTLESVDQSVRLSVQTVSYSSPRALSNLLAQADLGVEIQFGRGEGVAYFHPQGGSQATSRQYKRMHQQLEEWSEKVATYLDAATETYAYLELNPTEKMSAFSHLFDSHDVDSRPLTPQAEDLVLRLKDSMGQVAEQALEISKGSGWSLNELTHLAFDPFPPRLTISVSGDVIDAEGFEDIGGVWERPSVSLWTVLRTLEGNWIHPALVTAVISPGDLDQLPDPDPREFAGVRLSAAPAPSASEVLATLVAELEVETPLSLRWEMRTTRGDDLTVSPQNLLDFTENAALSAESSLNR